MMLSADKVVQLRGFGLSEYQARAYLALLRLGRTEARHVSRLAKIPTAKVYQTLQQLQERGLAVIYSETPRQYGPVPFHQFLERLREEHEASIRSLERVADGLGDDLAPAEATDSDDRGTMTAVRGRGALLDAFGQLAGRAGGRLLVVPSHGSLAGKAWPVLQRHLAHAAGRGARIRLLADAVEPTDLADGIETGPRPAHVPYAAFVACADEAALLGNVVPDDGDARRGNDVGILLTQPGLARLVVDLLEGAPPRLVAPRATAARQAWRRAQSEAGPGAALGRMPDGMLFDLADDEATPPEERAIFLSALRHRFLGRTPHRAAEPMAVDTLL